MTGHIVVNLYLMTLLCLICIDQIQVMHHVISAQIVKRCHVVLLSTIAHIIFSILLIALVTVRQTINQQMDYHHVNSVVLGVQHGLLVISRTVGVEILSGYITQDQLYVTAYKVISVQLVMIMSANVKNALLVLRLLSFLEVRQVIYY